MKLCSLTSPSSFLAGHVLAFALSRPSLEEQEKTTDSATFEDLEPPTHLLVKHRDFESEVQNIQIHPSAASIYPQLNKLKKNAFNNSCNLCIVLNPHAFDVFSIPSRYDFVKRSPLTPSKIRKLKSVPVWSSAKPRRNKRRPR